jgi:hypothetical protein
MITSMSSSYQRLGDSNFYFDPATGMFWDGGMDPGSQRWLTREQYDQITAQKWR